MKKIIQISTLFCLSIHGLNYSIENRTDGQIHILLEYEANSLCTPTERIIKKDQTVTIKSGLCRAHHITIHGIDELFTIQKQIKNKSHDLCTIRIMQQNSSSQSRIDQSNNEVLVVDQSE